MDKLLSLLFGIIILYTPAHAFAQSDLHGREEVFEFLEKAFESQVSLSEKGRSMAEIDSILDPYFTEAYKSGFIKENVVGQENNFQTYGTDFALYYIPFYAFSEKTRVVQSANRIYVVEFFPTTKEGPVGYEDHYEGLQLVQEKDGWKVADYWYDQVPQEVIQQAYPEKIKSRDSAISEREEKPFFSDIVYGPNFSALKMFLELGVVFRNETRTILFGIL